MGAGASVQEAALEVTQACKEGTFEGLQETLTEELRAKLLTAIALPSAVGDASQASDAKAAADSGAAAADKEGEKPAQEGGEDDIPAEWGWPKEPLEACVLRQFVLHYTKDSSQEGWDKALAERSVGGTFEDFMIEKGFANLLLNKEGTGEEKDHKGIDPNAYLKGKWYRFMNAKGDCYVYVHNYTCDITSSKPENFSELSPEEQARLNRLGVYIKELPEKLQRIYDKQNQIPIVFASQDTAEALKKFAEYDKDWQLLDCAKLKRVNAQGLEDSRQAIVNAMKFGKMLCIYLGDHIPELQEKICVTKNRDTFPLGTWQYNGLLSDMVKEKIYRDDDKEGGQYVVRDGFRVCVVLMYDTLMYEMSSMRREELPGKIPNYTYMEPIRCYADHDIDKLLQNCS